MFQTLQEWCFQTAVPSEILLGSGAGDGFGKTGRGQNMKVQLMEVHLWTERFFFSAPIPPPPSNPYFELLTPQYDNMGR